MTQYFSLPNIVAKDVYYNKTNGSNNPLFCNICWAVVYPSTMKPHEEFHNSYTNRKDGNMSSVLWCDPGNHAFKAGSPGAIHLNGTQQDENGIQVSIDTDACGEHNPYAPKAVQEQEQRYRLTAEAEAELNRTTVEYL